MVWKLNAVYNSTKLKLHVTKIAMADNFLKLNGKQFLVRFVLGYF